MIVIATRRMHYKHHHAIPYADCLKPVLTITRTRVFAGDGMVFKDHLTTGKIETMLTDVGQALGFVEGDHDILYIR